MDDIHWDSDWLTYTQNETPYGDCLPLDFWPLSLPSPDTQLSELAPGELDGNMSGPASPATPARLYDASSGANSPTIAPLSTPEAVSPTLRASIVSRYPKPAAARYRDNSSTPGVSLQRRVNGAGRPAHSEVERRYRESVNTSIERLRQALLSAGTAAAADVASNECGADSDQPAPRRLSKARIISAAVDSIRGAERARTQLEKQNALLVAEVARLQQTAEAMRSALLLTQSVPRCAGGLVLNMD